MRRKNSFAAPVFLCSWKQMSNSYDVYNYSSIQTVNLVIENKHRDNPHILGSCGLCEVSLIPQEDSDAGHSSVISTQPLISLTLAQLLFSELIIGKLQFILFKQVVYQKNPIKSLEQYNTILCNLIVFYFVLLLVLEKHDCFLAGPTVLFWESSPKCKCRASYSNTTKN